MIFAELDYWIMVKKGAEKMVDRRGEKIGWLAGWIGGFSWVAILSVIFMAKGQWAPGCAGLLLLLVAWATVVFLSPWRHPKTPYWKLMLGPYALLVPTAFWMIWAFGGIEKSDWNGWSLLWLLPLFIPVGVLGNRCWDDYQSCSDRKSKS